MIFKDVFAIGSFAIDLMLQATFLEVTLLWRLFIEANSLKATFLYATLLEATL